MSLKPQQKNTIISVLLVVFVVLLFFVVPSNFGSANTCFDMGFDVYSIKALGGFKICNPLVIFQRGLKPMNIVVIVILVSTVALMYWLWQKNVKGQKKV